MGAGNGLLAALVCASERGVSLGIQCASRQVRNVQVVESPPAAALL